MGDGVGVLVGVGVYVEDTSPIGSPWFPSSSALLPHAARVRSIAKDKAMAVILKCLFITFFFFFISIHFYADMKTAARN